MNWKQLLSACAVASLLAACSSTKPPVATGTTAGTGTAATAGDAANANGSNGNPALDALNDPNGTLAKRSVYFDFDSSVVKGDYKPLVAAHADYLKAHPTRKVVLQGNTDARGSREYNLGLGQRRAESVKQAMEVLGVADKQLEAVSFGKEKPRATGTSDADYAQNRRADIVYDGQQ